MKVKICANTSIEESQMCIDAEADIKMKMIRKIEKKYEDLLPMLKM